MWVYRKLGILGLETSWKAHITTTLRTSITIRATRLALASASIAWRNGLRVTASEAYLSSDQPNITILTETTITKNHYRGEEGRRCRNIWQAL